VSPSPGVLRAFALPSADRCVPVDGGQGGAWRCGQVVLKPSVDAAADEWIADAVQRLTPQGYRLPRPRRAVHGAWVFDGWCAWEVVAGEHGSGGRWPEILEVGRRLLLDLTSLPRPPFLDVRTDQWARGDRVAWDDRPTVTHPALGELVAQVAPLRCDEQLPEQVIHSDLYGNVLFSEGLPPAVIDLSPMWHPAAYCLAIAAVDAIAWYAADPAVLSDLRDLDGARSLLARAAIFRLATADCIAAERGDDYISQTVREFTPVVAAIRDF